MELSFHTLVCLWMLEQGLRLVCSVGYGYDAQEREELCRYIREVLGMRCFVFSNSEVVVMASPLTFVVGTNKEVIDYVPHQVMDIATTTPRFRESYESFTAWAKLFGYPQLSRPAFEKLLYRDASTSKESQSPLLLSKLMVKIRMAPPNPFGMLNQDMELLMVYHEEGDQQHEACMRTLKKYYQKLRGQFFSTDAMNYSFTPGKTDMPIDEQFYWDTMPAT